MEILWSLFRRPQRELEASVKPEPVTHPSLMVLHGARSSGRELPSPALFGSRARRHRLGPAASAPEFSTSERRRPTRAISRIRTLRPDTLTVGRAGLGRASTLR